jgi:DNA-binding transcriptional LysR family regulator
VKLFERRARGVEPTEAGRALVRHIRTLQASLHAMESEVVEFARGIKGHLRIVANSGSIAECLPADLASFSNRHPQIRISLEDLTSAEVQAAVAEGRADVGIFTPPVLDNRLDTRSYRFARLSVLVPRGHALSNQGAVRFAELLDHDLVGLHAGAAAHEVMREQAAMLGKTLKARLQVRGFDAIAQLVEAGLGVAILPQGPAERFAQVFSVDQLTLQEPWAAREYRVAVPKQQSLPAVVQRFVDALCPPQAAAATAAALAAAQAAGVRKKPAPG